MKFHYITVFVYFFVGSSVLSDDQLFCYRATYGEEAFCYSIFSADFNADNDVDLAVTMRLSQCVSILLNNGQGTFGSAINYYVGRPTQLVFSADLDRDNDFDLAVANRVYVNGMTSVLFNIHDEVLGDADSDQTINVADAVYLIDYVFKGGPSPCCT